MRAKPILVFTFLALAGLVPLIPGSVAETTVLETFESCLSGSVPPCDEPEFYSYSDPGGTSEVRSTQAIGTKAYLQDTAGSATSEFTFDGITGVELCTSTGIEYSWAFLIDEAPGAGTSILMQLDAEGDLKAGLTVTETLDVRAIVSVSGEDLSASLFQGSLDTWYNITVSEVTCGSGQDTEATFTPGHTSGGTIDTVNTDASTGLDSSLTINTQATGIVWLDNFQISGIPGVLAGPNIPAGAGLNVNGNIVGFDVDDTGSTIIIRESDQDSADSNVTTISGVTMTNLSNPTVTGCARLDGVMAEQSVVGYIQCSSGDPTHLFVKNATGLGDPNFDADCAGYCTSEISLSGFSPAGGDGALELGEIEDFPLSHTRHTFFFGDGQAHLAWAFSGFDCPAGYPCAGSQPGIIGVNTFSNFDNVGDTRETEETAYGGVNKGAEDICIVPGVPDTARLVAAHEASSTNRYLVTFTLDTEGLHAAMVNEGSYAGFTGSRGVSCTNVGDSKVLISLEKGSGVDEAWLVNATTGIAYWPGLTGLDAPARGVAVSGDGNFFAVVDGSQIHVGNATTGNITGTATMPPLGTFVGLELDRFGQTMWVATTKNVTRYTLTAFTTVIPCCFQAPPGGTGAPTGGIAGSGGPLDPALAGTAIGTGAFGGGLFLSALMILGMAVIGTAGVYEVGRRGQGVGSSALGFGAAAGAIVGFLLSWAFNWLNAGAVFVVVILLAGAIYFRFRSSQAG